MTKNNDKNYYDILDVQKDATPHDIKKAYKKMAFIYHPDRNIDNKDDNNFKLISEAYTVLSDNRKKQIYDFGGYSTYNNSYIDPFELFNKSFNDNINIFTTNGDYNEYDDILKNFSNINFTDINKIFDTFSKTVSTEKNNGIYDFNELFNFGMNLNKENNKKSNDNDLIYNLNISICDLYNEVEKKVTINRIKKCKDSEGLFDTYKNKQKIYNIVFYNRNVRFKKKGNESKNGVGDLFFNIYPKESNGYNIIKEHDLIKEFNIKINDIYSGYILELIHLDNKKYYIQHTISSFLDRGNLLFKIPSLGLPYKCKDITKRGNLYIKYNLILPSNINEINSIKNDDMTQNKTTLNENWLVAYNVAFNEIL